VLNFGRKKLINLLDLKTVLIFRSFTQLLKNNLPRFQIYCIASFADKKMFENIKLRGTEY